jgi:hypothetical protein
MKKLLALILCVMMFVSVIPTMAFAADEDQQTAGKTTTVTATAQDSKKDPTIETKATYVVTEDDKGNVTKVETTKDYTILVDNNKYPIINNPIHSVASYEKEIKDMIKETKNNIATAYGTLIGDQVVYTSAKTMDDTIVDLVDALTKKLVDEHKTLPTFNGGTYTFTKNSVNVIKNQVRFLIDDMVAADMAKTWKYTDADGNVDPLKYAQTFNKAVTDALTDKKFMKGYEAVATWAGLWALCADINDQLDDEYTAFAEGVDKSFDANFKFRYPDLWKSYVDTLDDRDTFLVQGVLAGLTADEAAAAALLLPDDPWAETNFAYVSMS